MDLREIKQYLKDNLSVSVVTDEKRGFGTNYVSVEVTLELEGEVISRTTDNIYN